jgi:hypothetical protein
VARICGAVPFLERFCHFEMEWILDNVTEFIELYKRKEIWDRKHPMHFNKIKKKQDAWKEMGKEINRAVNECKKKTEIIMSSNGKK